MAEVFFVPNGPANLQAVFPTVDMENVAEYFIEILDNSGNVVGTSPMTQLFGCDSGDCGDYVRVRFLNYLGGVDGITGKIEELTHESKSDSYQKPTTNPLNKNIHSINRFNVKGNDSYKLCSINYREEDMEWLDELWDSPTAWIEWPDVQGQGRQYIPIVMLDGKSTKRKLLDRYVYQLEIEFKLSHERFIIRN